VSGWPYLLIAAALIGLAMVDDSAAIALFVGLPLLVLVAFALEHIMCRNDRKGRGE
jgi:hypothetical protein